MVGQVAPQLSSVRLLRCDGFPEMGPVLFVGGLCEVLQSGAGHRIAVNHNGVAAGGRTFAPAAYLAVDRVLHMVAAWSHLSRPNQARRADRTPMQEAPLSRHFAKIRTAGLGS